MIELTVSRVCVCICGIAMLAAVVGMMSASIDEGSSDADMELVTDIAAMLDSIQRSEISSVTLEGNRILPTTGHSLSVREGIVELRHDGNSFYAMTVLEQDLELTYGSSVTIVKSVTEGLGYVADGIGEDVDLLGTVVEVHGCPGTSVYTA